MLVFLTSAQNTYLCLQLSNIIKHKSHFIIVKQLMQLMKHHTECKAGWSYRCTFTSFQRQTHVGEVRDHLICWTKNFGVLQSRKEQCCSDSYVACFPRGHKKLRQWTHQPPLYDLPCRAPDPGPDPVHFITKRPRAPGLANMNIAASPPAITSTRPDSARLLPLQRTPGNLAAKSRAGRSGPSNFIICRENRINGKT